MSDESGLSVPATRTQRAPHDLDMELLNFLDELDSRPLPSGVAGYTYGNSTRSESKQQEFFDAGLSAARYGESPHNWNPALGVDVFAVDDAGDVINDPAAYAEIGQLAWELDLRWGADFDDFGHVELYHWRTYTIAGDDRAGLGLAALLAAVLVALALRG